MAQWRGWYTFPLAAVVAATGLSCAHSQTPAEQTQAAAERSDEAFKQAAEDQKKLEEQQKRADAAHRNVQIAQQQLAEAQIREEQERSKAQQLQQQATEHLQQVGQRAQQARAVAGQEQSQGMQTITGQVAQATPNQVVLQTSSGRTMTFILDQRTRVLVGSEERSAADIQQGADAQVAYEQSGGQPTALTIQITPPL